MSIPQGPGNPPDDATVAQHKPDVLPVDIAEIFTAAGLAVE